MGLSPRSDIPIKAHWWPMLLHHSAAALPRRSRDTPAGSAECLYNSLTLDVDRSCVCPSPCVAQRVVRLPRASADRAHRRREAQPVSNPSGTHEILSRTLNCAYTKAPTGDTGYSNTEHDRVCGRDHKPSRHRHASSKVNGHDTCRSPCPVAVRQSSLAACQLLADRASANESDVWGVPG